MSGLLAAVCLAPSAYAQISPADWTVTYSSPDGYTRIRTVDQFNSVSDTGNMPWWIGPNESQNPLGGAITTLKAPPGGQASAWIDGTVVVHFHWNNPNTAPPPYAWIAVSGFAQWGGNVDSATGSADDALGDPAVVTGFTQTKKGAHILCKKGAADFTFQYHIHAEVHGVDGGLLNCICNLSAVQTSRSIDVNTGALHNKRALAGWDEAWEVPDNNPANEGGTKVVHYPKAVPVVNDEVTDDGVNVIRNIDYGLHAEFGTEGQDVTWTKTRLFYQGVASQEHIPNESYSYILNNGPGVSETLPSGLFENGWDILAAHGDYVQPLFDVYEYIPTKFFPHDGHSTDSVNFHYIWNDGTQGTAILNVKFHPDSDNEQNVNTSVYRFPDAPWHPLTFVTGAEWTKQVNETAEDIKPAEPPLTMKDYFETFEQVTGFLKLGEVFTPECELVSTVGGILINPGTSDDPTVSLNRDGFDDALANGRVLPSDWNGPDGWHSTAWDPDPIVHMLWKGEYQEGKIVTYTVSDVWDDQGYVGQHQLAHSRPEGPLEARRRYWFQYSSGKGSDGQGG
ncbi:MAG TPA: hypothetical protein VHE55_18185 [Fimbriimonadaceae bacterium]|nr:hypothetical protein [Fimbriimonadaceae bacterium]